MISRDQFKKNMFKRVFIIAGCKVSPTRAQGEEAMIDIIYEELEKLHALIEERKGKE